MRRSNCAGALQYVPELTWILFLRILDEREQREAEEAEAVGAEFTPSLESPYRWRDWADPGGPKRRDLGAATLGAMFSFVHEELLPYLKRLEDKPGATPRQKVISEIMSGVERTRIDTEKNFLDVLDRVHGLSDQNMYPTHVFPLAGVRGARAQDGREGERPRLRYGRVPCTGLRAHGRRREREDHVCGAARNPQAPHLLRQGEGQRDLSDRPGQPGPPQHRRAARPARQHADRPGDVRGAVRRFAGAVRRDPDESPLRRQGGQGGPDSIRVQDGGDASPFPPARDRQPEAGRAMRHRAGRGCAVPHQ